MMSATIHGYDLQTKVFNYRGILKGNDTIKRSTSLPKKIAKICLSFFVDQGETGNVR